MPAYIQLVYIYCPCKSQPQTCKSTLYISNAMLITLVMRKSTKGQGQGQGQGVTSCYSTVHLHSTEQPKTIMTQPTILRINSCLFKQWYNI